MDNYDNIRWFEKMQVTKENAKQVPPHNIRFVWYEWPCVTKTETLENSAWQATLYVSSSNPLRTLRDGFHISPADEVRDTGCITPYICPEKRGSQHWKHSRRYIFLECTEA
ncbi:hypothetical protein CkaCkLH20_06372 [Colletotrichum karsti]|uniref:Uncharacterized protein n=1 Tax=Colletotrichum karsti TaxID=1095194 RepID=A0A9P6LK85_9PEZI|nr:uncharacterized protein CkaCkLH20_06372 [Colletotrichum karsti]KAF9875926.1 hypothetical protein CkaCkLH20_06372 [Colletotrichum karsti]